MRKLNRYLAFEPDAKYEINNLLTGYGPKYLRKVTNQWGQYFIRVHNKQNRVVAYSEVFDNIEDRDEIFDKIIEAHGHDTLEDDGSGFFMGLDDEDENDDEDDASGFFSELDDVEAQLDAFFA